MNEKRAAIEKHHPVLTIAEQCALLGINRSSYYYQEKGMDAETEKLMKLLDKHYTNYPHEGKIKRALWLSEQVGYSVGKKHVSHLMQEMGLKTVYPKPNISVPDKAHAIYPYLLRDTEIVLPNQVWSTDITYGAPSLWNYRI